MEDASHPLLRTQHREPTKMDANCIIERISRYIPGPDDDDLEQGSECAASAGLVDECQEDEEDSASEVSESSVTIEDVLSEYEDMPYDSGHESDGASLLQADLSRCRHASGPSSVLHELIADLSFGSEHDSSNASDCSDSWETIEDEDSAVYHGPCVSIGSLHVSDGNAFCIAVGQDEGGHVFNLITGQNLHQSDSLSMHYVTPPAWQNDMHVNGARWVMSESNGLQLESWTAETPYLDDEAEQDDDIVPVAPADSFEPARYHILTLPEASASSTAGISTHSPQPLLIQAWSIEMDTSSLSPVHAASIEMAQMLDAGVFNDPAFCIEEIHEFEPNRCYDLPYSMATIYEEDEEGLPDSGTLPPLEDIDEYTDDCIDVVHNIDSHPDDEQNRELSLPPSASLAPSPGHSTSVADAMSLLDQQIDGRIDQLIYGPPVGFVSDKEALSMEFLDDYPLEAMCTYKGNVYCASRPANQHENWLVNVKPDSTHDRMMGCWMQLENA